LKFGILTFSFSSASVSSISNFYSPSASHKFFSMSSFEYIFALVIVSVSLSSKRLKLTSEVAARNDFWFSETML
jgi:hypothetical protein